MKKVTLGTVLFAISLMFFQTNSYAYTVLFDSDFENGNGDLYFFKKCRDSQFNIISDPFNSKNKAMRIFQEGKRGCLEGEEIKKRSYLMLGKSTKMHELIPSIKETYNSLVILPEHDYWIGFRFNVDPSTPDSNSDRAFMFASKVGEPAILLRGNDTLNIIPERYKSPSGFVENRESNHAFTPGKWHTLLIHWRKGYMKNKDGIYEVWLDGKQIVDEHNIIAGTDRSTPTGLQTGIYFGSGDRPGNYTMLMDDITVVHGTDGQKYPFFGNSVTTAPSPPVAPLQVKGEKINP